MNAPAHADTPCRRAPELLAPAGSPEAACAAFQYGADAVYLGLRSLSARADAVNFSPAELDAAVALAHSLEPRRSVYVTVNTLLRDGDLPSALDSLATVAASGADGVIVQDPAVVALARRFFPSLALHASTQMAIHNLAGAAAARDIGFSRVVLARELPLDTVAAIARDSGVEIEVFVHGALCYAYSGLCLFSSHASGRSGNRGRCAYCCRESFRREGATVARPHFSMRDLSLLPHLPALARAGVASLKIEGRMKGAAYVAAVSDLYRRKLDGRLSPDEERERLQDLQTIFSRPVTSLHFAGRAPAASVIDASAVGHRGAPVGRVESVRRERGEAWLRFRSSRALERHDGLQVDVPGSTRPFGFALARLRLARDPRPRLSTPAGALVEAALPPDAPRLPEGATVFCSSSLAVRRRFEVSLPVPSAPPRRPIDVAVRLSPGGARFEAAARAKDGAPLFATADIPGPLDAARQPEATPGAVRKAFLRLGDTRWTPGSIAVDDPQGRFLPASRLNDARRELAARLDAADDAAADAAHSALHAALADLLSALPAAPSPPRAAELWTAKLDAADPPATFDGAGEIILELGFSPWPEVRRSLDAWRRLRAAPCLRLALPELTREGDWPALAANVRDLLREGWSDWECADLAGLSLLRASGTSPEPASLTADGPLAALNRLAKAALAERGVSRVATSAEDDLGNILSHAKALPETEALLFQHTPLFLAETPPLLDPASGGRPAASASGELAAWSPAGVRFADRRGRTLRTLVRGSFATTVDERPFSAIDVLPRLRAAGIRAFRADFRWLPLSREERAGLWDALRRGAPAFARHDGNLARGLE